MASGDALHLIELSIVLSMRLFNISFSNHNSFVFMAFWVFFFVGFFLLNRVIVIYAEHYSLDVYINLEVSV